MTTEDEVRALEQAAVYADKLGCTATSEDVRSMARLHPARLAVVEAAKGPMCGGGMKCLNEAVDALLALEASDGI